MLKSEIISKLNQKFNRLSLNDTEKILNLFLEKISNSLYQNKNIEIRGFGSYKIVKRKARTGRNPKNSEMIQIPAKKAIKWKMSKTLFNRLNKI